MPRSLLAFDRSLLGVCLRSRIFGSSWELAATAARLRPIDVSLRRVRVLDGLVAAPSLCRLDEAAIGSLDLTLLP